MKKLFFLILTALLTSAAHAFDIGLFTFYITSTNPKEVGVVVTKPENASLIEGHVTIPSTVIYKNESYEVAVIRDWGFEDCDKMTSITIPNTIKEIGMRAFANCIGLTSITIPASVTSIQTYPFLGCTNLSEIKIEEGNDAFCTVDGVLLDKSRGWLIACPEASTVTDFIVPDWVTCFLPSAFEGCKSLKSVIISDSIEEIEHHTFSGCTNLESVKLPDSLREIWNDSFLNCSSLTSIVIPDKVDLIEAAFVGCSNLSNVSLPKSLKMMDGAFIDCTSLTDMIIPKKVFGISGAFKGCTSLSSIVIPQLIDILDHGSFYGCKSLKKIITLRRIAPTVRDDAFTGVPADAVVYIPKGSLESYREKWNMFTDFREMGGVEISLSAKTLTLAPGATSTISAEIENDDDVTVDSVSWSSSNPSVATVSEDGTITAVSEGTAEISYEIVDNYGCPHSEECTVTVVDAASFDDVLPDYEESKPEYYNLQGVRVASSNLAPGIYIVRQGNKVNKLYIK